MQDDSLLLQLLLRLWLLLATWARGSERMRYLWWWEGPGCRSHLTPGAGVGAQGPGGVPGAAPAQPGDTALTRCRWAPASCRGAG